MKEIFHRTSIRKYKDKPVEEEKIEMMLKAAMAAPSAKNQQPWEFYVVTNKEKLVELSGTSPYAGFVKDAPLVFVACYRTHCDIPQYAQIDMSASVENILLEADSLGLGAVWIGIAPIEERMEAVRKALEIPDSLQAFAIISCGYPEKVENQKDRFEKERIHYIR